MAIKIKQYEKKWRIEIEREEWEFENRADVDYYIKLLLGIKEDYGRIN